MKDETQIGLHLDADRLTGFAEGTLAVWEREESLAHLAACGECREVLFLAQKAAEMEQPEAAAVRPWWRRWMESLPGGLPIGVPIGGALVACALVAGVWVHTHRGGAATVPGQMAEVQPAEEMVKISPGVAEPVRPPAVRELDAREPAAREMDSRERVRDRAAGLAAVRRPEVPAPRPVLQPASPKAALAPRSQSFVSLGMVAPAAVPNHDVHPSAVRLGVASAGAAGAGSAGMAGLPPAAAPKVPVDVSKALSAAKAPTYTHMENRSASMVSNMAMSASPPAGIAVKIVHDGGAADGMSEVRGSVADASGAVVAGATVTLRPLAGEVVARTTTANAKGEFALAAVAAGRYALEISSPGFKVESRQIELAPRDVAQVTPVLQAGSAAETVEVSSANAVLAMDQVADTAFLKQKDMELPVATRVESGGSVVVVDAEGALFVSNHGGKRWKRVKAAWKGKVARLALAPNGAPGFELTTDAGEVWASVDGKRWARL